MSGLDLVIAGRERDLGGFSVHRVLPCASHPMVGPFIFFDHMGPAVFASGQAIDVRPHPHIHLATVTYLFEGVIRHRDSLGSDQLIQPGAVNWMTAGHGIVHSERTPEPLRETGSRLNGIQCWIALPDDKQDIAPNFTHYPAEALPEFEIEGVKIKLLLGKAFDRVSPVEIYSPLFYLEAHFKAGMQLVFKSENQEVGVYVAQGEVKGNQQNIEQFAIGIGRSGEDFVIEALQDSHVMILGGKPLSKRVIYWNFVSNSEANIEQAKADWANGPGPMGSRFPKVPGDDKDYIPLPVEQNPKGTIM